ncbi:MAG: fatty acyl-AMP ligase [Catenulispora sp.]
MSPARTVAELVAGLDRDDRGLTFLADADDDGVFVSFRELGRLTADLAARWAASGFRPGDRVLLVVTDEREFALLFLSAIRAGLVPAPVVPPFAFGRLEAYREGLRRLAKIAEPALCVAGAAVLPAVAEAGLSCPVASAAEIFAAEPAPMPDPPDPADPALLQFTSGSTGEPRGVRVSHRAVLSHVRSLTEALAIDGDTDRGVSWLPLFHDMGLIGKLVSCLASQTGVWFLPPHRFARDPGGFLRLMTRVRGTISFAPNFAYGLLARRADPAGLEALDLSAWRVAGCGAEPIRPDTLRAFAEAYRPAGFPARALTPSYGLAEATLTVCVTPPGSGMTTRTVDAAALAEGRVVLVGAGPGGRELVSCGRPMPGVAVGIVDPSGRPLPEAEIGEIVVTAGHLADGYADDPEATAAAFRGPALHTGDTGFLLDAELYVTGRIKDLIIVNGRNHHPHDIERIAEEVGGVRPHSAVAVPMPGRDTEAVRLVVEATAYPPPDGLAGQLAAAVRRQAGVPVADVTIVRRGALPKTSSGKPRRRLTAELVDSGRLAPWNATRSKGADVP